MDYLALRIPVDVKPITSHTVTDQPEPEDGGGYPFEGENGAYALTDTQTIADRARSVYRRSKKTAPGWGPVLR